MPRKLPWLNKGSATETPVKSARKLAKRPRAEVESDDDDFFTGTVLASSRKGKERADSPASDDELPTFPVQTSQKGKGRVSSLDQLSSSPPPAVSEQTPPRIEFMRKGVDKFDLRDDEWMMVEDEFLQTAKLFTRHLHLAEYERLKKNLDTKKEIARPVVPNAKPSAEGRMRMKAQTQAKEQKKALKICFKLSDQEEAGDDLDAPVRGHSSRLPSSSFSGASRTSSAAPSRAATHPLKSHLSSKVPEKRPTLSNALAKKVVSPEVSDSDGLDAVPRTKLSASKMSFTSTSHKGRSSLTKDTSAKASLPSKNKPTVSRTGRASTFDFLDDLPPKRSPSPSKSSDLSKSKFASTGRSRTSACDLLDDFDLPKRYPLPKDHADRIAKRKAEREEKDQGKRKSLKLDEIPTFLV
ncbi:hypothetical protein K469DRAFT_736879 [Zopfia rhizophila CBS 207.26]|uniref:Uncharacterized protein n=1 Tax=Zopfia rhizophila CBS 207.26 TaxID=1314779 RepID=A0A6A6EFE5_9PEZI|nr:hypothetical protein K469DRAFT_736879 [Zopfia rhizophila CBS 207.26]